MGDITIVQQDVGTFEGTSDDITLPNPTEEGSQILIILGRIGDNTNSRAITPPTGFSAFGTASWAADLDYARPRACVKASATGGEQLWTLPTLPASARVVWAAFELQGMDLDFAQLTYLPNLMGGNGGSPVASLALDATQKSETFDGLCLGVYMGTTTSGGVPTIDGYTGNFAEIATVSGTDSSGRATRLSVITKDMQAIQTPACTASFSPSAYAAGYKIVITSLTAKHAPNILAMSGAEVGSCTNYTNTGLDTGLGSRAPWDVVTGTPAVVTTFRRSGTYCWELSSTSAAESLAWTNGSGSGQAKYNLNGAGDVETWADTFCVYFPTALPSADVEIASIEAGSLANGCTLWYRSASQKFEMKIGTGTGVACDATLTAGRWIRVERFYDPRGTTHTAKWIVDYNAETSPEDTVAAVVQADATATGMTAAVVSTVRYGWTNSVTATVRYDDIAGSRVRKAYPIGDTRIVPLAVTGTPVLNGTSANFKVFTNNGGTLSNWSASGTIDALNEKPFVIGASADGLAQVSNASTEYVEVAMSDFVLLPNRVAIAARWYWAGWAATTNPATFRFNPMDDTGSILGVLGSTTDGGFDDTTLVWMGLMHAPDLAYNPQFNQAKVNGLKGGWGYGIDQNPDAGVHGVIVELAWQPTESIHMFGNPSGTPRVTQSRNPNTGAIVSLNAYMPYWQTGTLTWWDSGGTPHPETIPTSANPFTVEIDAASVDDVPRVELELDVLEEP